MRIAQRKESPMQTTERRTVLLQSTIGLVENLSAGRPTSSENADRFSPEFQVCLPYRGLFVWHVGHDEVVADANQVLFVSGGESCRLSQPLPVGFAELIVTPDPELLAEIAGAPASRLLSHQLFRRRSRCAD